MKKLATGFVIIAFSVSCASTAGLKKNATVALAATHSALNLVQDVTLQTECDKPSAPPAPVCIPSPIANQIHSKLVIGYKIHEDAVILTKSLPPSIDGSLTPQLLEFITKIWAVVDDIRVLFPSEVAAKAELEKTLDKLEKN